MNPYDLDYALKRARDAVDYTEETRDPEGFAAIRRWLLEVERSAKAEIRQLRDAAYILQDERREGAQTRPKSRS